MSHPRTAPAFVRLSCTAHERDEIMRMFRQGYSIDAIASKTRIEVCRVSHIVNRSLSSQERTVRDRALQVGYEA